MLKINISFLVMAVLAVNGAGAGGCGVKQEERSQKTEQVKNKNAPAKPSPATGGEMDEKQSEIKVLAEGAQSRVKDAFVAIARDPETYAALRSASAGGLPEMDLDFFRSNAVVAAFLGQRRTGGYTISITSAGGGRVRVSEKAPPKGAMVTQAFTAPFKIVSVPISEGGAFKLEMDGLWKEAMRPYRITEGAFELSGGIAGRREQMGLAGEMRVATYGNLVTFAFDLKATGATRERLLPGVATGVKEADGRVHVARLDAGSLVEEPHGGLRATGQFADSEGKLSLSFEPLPSGIADSFSGAGRLEAVATAPPPKRTDPKDAEVM